MNSVGIVGAGISGLQLGLFLQQRGVGVTIYSEKSPDDIRASRVANFVVRFDHTRQRERALGVNHWDFADFGVTCVHMHIGVEPPIVWTGSLKQQASGVDMRIYQSTLLEDFANRGGSVRIGPIGADDVRRLSGEHDVMVVAAGGRALAGMFPRDPERSPYTAPQRRITGVLCQGLRFPDPLGVIYTISPGHGEIFQAPFTTLSGRACSLLIEGIPGQGFESVMNIRYEDDPREFEDTLLALLRRHAPPIYDRVDFKEFRVTRAEDVLQGAITPIVRTAYTVLDSGKYAIAVGDAHILQDPVIGQGANTGSRCAWVLGEALLQDRPADEAFCRDVEQRMWDAARAATEWTNMVLQPPRPHAMEVFAAAAQDKAIADELVSNFNEPERNWEIFGSAEGAAAFLRRHAVRASVR